jgi:hypothetical protein
MNSRDIHPIELKIKCMDIEPIHKFFKRIKEEI